MKKSPIRSHFGARMLSVYVLCALFFVYAPILVIPLFSFNDAVHVAFPLRGFTLRWYHEFLASDDMNAALINSIKVGIPVAIISTTMGALVAKSVTRYRIPGQGSVVAFMMLPMTIPSLIIAISLLVLMKFAGVPLSLWTIGFGHLLLCVPLAIVVMISQLEGFDKCFEEAAQDLGENHWGTFWRVTFPLILPGLVASVLLTFTVSFDETILALFLGGTEATLPVFIWGQLRFPAKLPSVLALASAILTVTFIVGGIAQFIRQKSSDHLSNAMPGKT